jgi:poly(3-hydroxybutyrate) depolymerase
MWELTIDGLLPIWRAAAANDPCSAVATTASNRSMDRSTSVSQNCNVLGSSGETDDIFATMSGRKIDYNCCSFETTV